MIDNLDDDDFSIEDDDDELDDNGFLEPRDEEEE